MDEDTALIRQLDGSGFGELVMKLVGLSTWGSRSQRRSGQNGYRIGNSGLATSGLIAGGLLPRRDTLSMIVLFISLVGCLILFLRLAVHG